MGDFLDFSRSGCHYDGVEARTAEEIVKWYEAPRAYELAETSSGQYYFCRITTQPKEVREKHKWYEVPEGYKLVELASGDFKFSSYPPGKISSKSPIFDEIVLKADQIENINQMEEILNEENGVMVSEPTDEEKKKAERETFGSLIRDRLGKRNFDKIGEGSEKSLADLEKAINTMRTLISQQP